MRVLSFVTQKGGSGKTTLAFCCAVAAREKGKRTIILDMDPQGTATAWFKDRESDKPTLANINRRSLLTPSTKRKKPVMTCFSLTPQVATSPRPQRRTDNRHY